LSADRRRVAVTGSSGFVGSALVDSLVRDGHDVVRIVRRESGQVESIIHWDPARGRLDAAELEGIDALVHLAGENIASARWTAARRQRIVESRVRGTRLIAEALTRLRRPPAVFVSASAIGYYGNRGDESLDERSCPGTGFLAETCRKWEAETAAAERTGLRVVQLRIGIVLGSGGGALGRMLLPFRLGLGGRIGSGRQFMSWIARRDLISAIRHVLFDSDLKGPVNAVAPAPVRNAEFTRVLGQILRRPARLPVPAFAIRLALGRLGQELLLEGARVFPRRLVDDGYRFRWGDLQGALKAELGR